MVQFARYADSVRRVSYETIITIGKEVYSSPEVH